jgi:FtsP/CotA-like multicopper oxidase with cupredoxin domain
MLTRRTFLGGSGAALLGAALVSKAGAASLPEAPTTASAGTAAPLAPPNGQPYTPVVTLNGWTLPWRMKNGWKEFHLIAEPVVREIAPGMHANLWGYNGQAPGPTIEAVEGDLVRIFVTNKLSEHTTVHWHGMPVPCGMDGVGGLTQPHIPPGKTFVYEFRLERAGTFMYHPHSDEMVQMAMGMMGLFVVHPRDPRTMPVDRDFAFLMSSYAIDPGTYTPRVDEMTDFNTWAWNARVFPGIDPLPVRAGDRVRIRFGNLTMTNHPMHLHGYSFEVTGTDGGWVPPTARWPEVTVDVGVGQMRAIEFTADRPGDWAFHCHKSHHTMNAMDHRTHAAAAAPPRSGTGPKHDQMAMQGMDGMKNMKGMHDMAGMHGAMESASKPLPENTLPMMAGSGPFGPLEMGGMFSVVKVREDLARDDYRDPGWYAHPRGTVASEYTLTSEPS